MSKSQVRVPVVLFAILAVVLTSCVVPTAPAPAAPAVEKVITQVVTQQVEKVVTQVVEKTVVEQVTPTPAPTEVGAKKVVNFWSMWSTQPLNQQFVNTVVADYMKAHPDVQLNVSYLGEGCPGPGPAGRPDGRGRRPGYRRRHELAPCLPRPDGCWISSGALPEDAFKPGILDAVTLTDPKGMYGYPIGIQFLYLFYNPQIFRRNSASRCRPTTSSRKIEFVDVVKKCNAAGYSGFANAVGDRNYPAIYPIWAALTQMVGGSGETKIDTGLTSWDTPETRQVLDVDEPTARCRRLAQELRHHGHRRLPHLLPHAAESLHDLHRQLLSGPRLQAGRIRAASRLTSTSAPCC